MKSSIRRPAGAFLILKKGGNGMAIQFRRGERADLVPENLLPGEPAYTEDGGFLIGGASGATEYATKTDLSGFLKAETGAYTPYLNGGHANVGCTYEIQRGQYYRIGKLCFFSVRLKGVITQSGQNACVTLPFPPDISQTQRFCFSLGEVVNAADQAVTAALTLGDDNRAIFFLQNGGKIVKWNVTGERFWFQASGCYITT